MGIRRYWSLLQDNTGANVANLPMPTPLRNEDETRAVRIQLLRGVWSIDSLYEDCKEGVEDKERVRGQKAQDRIQAIKKREGKEGSLECCKAANISSHPLFTSHTREGVAFRSPSRVLVHPVHPQQHPSSTPAAARVESHIDRPMSITRLQSHLACMDTHPLRSAHNRFSCSVYLLKRDV